MDRPEGLNFEFNGQSPLAVACNSNKTLDIVKLLLDHDADPNYILKEHNDTALHVAIAWKENIDIVEILLNYGGKIKDKINIIRIKLLIQ